MEVHAVKIVSELVANPAREISISDARVLQPEVEVGQEIRFRKDTEGLGRISAQLAKQVIFQKIREAERETIFNEYSDRIGEIVPCTVKRIEGPDLIVDIGRTEARLPRREQSRLESFSPGDRIRVVIKNIEKAGRGPAVIVSRASEELVKTLFEQEVPEIYDGTVKIMACGREAGERTKIAVQSSDRDVDAVGACVGMKGMRVQSIIRELRGEKIDIIEFSEEPVDMANRALSPANISRVAIIDPLARHLEVIVEETQLSLAIGKKGQNVRLAAKLMGWRIDIKGEDEKRQEVESAMAAMTGSGTPVTILIEHGLTENLVDKLAEAELSTVEKLADMTPEQLEEIPGIGPKMVEKITLAVGAYFGQFEQATPAQALPDFEQGSEEWSADGEGEPETDEQAAKLAAASVMPGLPVEGAEVDEDEDEDIDFDTMDEDSSYSSDENNEEQAEVIHPDTGSDKEQPQSAPVVESTPPAEDDVHDNLTAKESE